MLSVCALSQCSDCDVCCLRKARSTRGTLERIALLESPLTIPAVGYSGLARGEGAADWSGISTRHQ